MPAFNDIVRFRTNKAFKRRLRRVARSERRDPSTLARQVIEDYVAARLPKTEETQAS